jgi:hypothetical protein
MPSDLLQELLKKIKIMRETYSQTYDVDPTENFRGEEGEIDVHAQSLGLIAEGHDKEALVQQIQVKMDGWIPNSSTQTSDPWYFLLINNEEIQKFCDSVWPMLHPKFKELIKGRWSPLFIALAFHENYQEQSLYKMWEFLRHKGDGYFHCRLCLSLFMSAFARDWHQRHTCVLLLDKKHD